MPHVDGAIARAYGKTLCFENSRMDTSLPSYPNRGTGHRSVYAGEEIIILGKGKAQALAEWDEPVHFGTGMWNVVNDAENQASSYGPNRLRSP